MFPKLQIIVLLLHYCFHETTPTFFGQSNSQSLWAWKQALLGGGLPLGAAGTTATAGGGRQVRFTPAFALLAGNLLNRPINSTLLPRPPTAVVGGVVGGPVPAPAPGGLVTVRPPVPGPVAPVVGPVPPAPLITTPRPIVAPPVPGAVLPGAVVTTRPTQTPIVVIVQKQPYPYGQNHYPGYPHPHEVHHFPQPGLGYPPGLGFGQAVSATTGGIPGGQVTFAGGTAGAQIPQQLLTGQFPQQLAGQFPQQVAGQLPQQLLAGQFPQQLAGQLLPQQLLAGQFPQQLAGQFPQPGLGGQLFPHHHIGPMIFPGPLAPSPFFPPRRPILAIGK